jgi:hypothetical protein
MTDQERKLQELNEKVISLDNTIKDLSFRMKRTRKVLKNCRETCKTTNEMIGELNGRNKQQ